MRTYTSVLCLLVVLALSQGQPTEDEIRALPAKILQLYPRLTRDQLRRFTSIVVDNWNFSLPQTADPKRARQDPVPVQHCEPFTCDRTVRPTSVHSLRYCDIDVVGAVGDSITAGFGAGASNIFQVFTEWRGRSWSIGADRVKDSYGQDLFTLVNMLRNYNPNIYGFASGTGGASSSAAKFNQAVTGAQASGLPAQIRTLINKMRADSRVDWQNHWKLITIWIGGNDLCAVCNGASENQPPNYANYVRESIQNLYNEVPRVMVNLVLNIDVTRLSVLSGGLCSLLHSFECGCGTGSSSDKQKATAAFLEYNRLLETLPSQFEGRNDFTVVVQPLYVDTQVPRKSDGRPDSEYFAPDCFHFSTIGHEAASVGLWNNMNERVGEKRTAWAPDEEILCPRPEDFIPTNHN